MSSIVGKRPIQRIRRSAAIGAWGGRAAIVLSAIDFAVISWNAAVSPVPTTAMTILGWVSLAPLAVLAALFTRHVRIGIQSPRPIDRPKSVANDHFAISGWMCMASALVMALILIRQGA